MGHKRGGATSQPCVTLSLGRCSTVEAEILCWRKDQHAAQFPAKITAEVLLIAGQQMCGLGMDRGLQYRRVFFREPYIRRHRRNTSNDPDSLQEFCQSLALVLFGQVDSRFFSSIRRSRQLHFLERPRAGDAGSRPIGGGKEHVGIEEQTVRGHARVGLRGLWCGTRLGSIPSFFTSAIAAL